MKPAMHLYWVRIEGKGSAVMYVAAPSLDAVTKAYPKVVHIRRMSAITVIK